MKQQSKKNIVKKKFSPINTKKVENPFDKFSNSKKKHEVLNRRVKGEDRNVGRALAKAVEVRKNRLLRDYQRSKKSNNFIDKRFGEDDANLSLEDKMLARFQKERLKSSRNRSIFNLDSSSNDSFILTHKGTILSGDNIADTDDFSDADANEQNEENDALGKDIVNSLHFGGGMVKRNSSSINEPMASSSIDKYGNHMTALQEIVAKSKLAKLQRKEMKQEQLEETEKLDSEFQSLLKESLVHFREDDNKNRINSRDEAADDEDDYDKMLNSMLYESKVKPTDRTKSQEEIAIENHEKLEELEKERLERMKKSYQPELLQDKTEIDRHENKRNKKGKNFGASIHSKILTDDCLDDSFGGRGDEIDESGNDVGVEDEDEFSHEDEFLNDDEEEDDDDDDDDDADEGVDCEDGSDSYDDEKKFLEDEHSYSEGDFYENEIEMEGDGGDAVEEEVGTVSAANKVQLIRSSQSHHLDQLMPIDRIPHKIICPTDMNQFDSLIDTYAKSSEDVILIIDRILLYNSVHLPGKLGSENKSLMHNFMEILFRHFVRVADSLSSALVEKGSDSRAAVEKQLDHLTVTLFKLSHDIFDICGSLWGKRIKIFQSQLQKRLRDYAQGVIRTPWPSLGQLLFFQMVSKIFSTSDYRHIIVESACLFLCQCLSQCPVNSIPDLSSGLLSASILLDMSKESKKIIPECFSFVGSCYGLYSVSLSTLDLNSVNISTSVDDSIQRTFNTTQFSWLKAFIDHNSSLEATTFEDRSKDPAVDCDMLIASPSIDWSYFNNSIYASSNCGGEASQAAESKEASAVFTVLLSITHVLADRFATLSVFPELFHTILSSLKSLNLSKLLQQSTVNTQILNSYASLLEKIHSNTNRIKSTRQFLRWRTPVKLTIETKNPRFSVDYNMKKDKDVNETRVKLKQLTREKKREHKAVMRELRRDTDFLEQERFKEKTTQLEVARGERYKNFAWLEEQQATINQQVRKGGEVLRGGGSAIAKRKIGKKR